VKAAVAGRLFVKLLRIDLFRFSKGSELSAREGN
jgi:hypothetical protein